MRIIALFVLIIHSAMGQWPLDASFGNNGQLSMTYYDYQEVEQMKKMSDGNILLATQAGRIVDGKYDNDVLLSKFTEDGNLVTNFGTNGHFVADFPGFETSLVKDFIELSSGYILVLGYAFNFDDTSYRPVVLMLLDPDGELITGIGVGGVLQFAPLGNSNTAYHLHQDKEGRILIAIGSNDPADNSGTVAVLMRLTSSYELDLSFGGTGSVEVDPTVGAMGVSNAKTNHASSTYFTDVYTTAEGDMYAVGSDFSVYQGSYIVKLKEEGTLDSSFYDNGIYSWYPSTAYNNSALKIEAMSNGDLLIPIKTDASNNNFTLLRIKDDVITEHVYEIDGEQDFLEHVVEDDDRNVYLIGRSVNTNTFNSASYANHYSIIKLLPGLTRDPSFGYDGVFQLEWDGEKEAGATEAVLSSEGQLILAGEVIESDKTAKTIGVIKLGESLMTSLSREALSQRVNVYPNPFQHQFFIDMEGVNCTQISIVDNLGNVYFEGTPTEEVQVESLSEGAYFLNLTVEGKIISKKIIKLR